MNNFQRTENSNYHQTNIHGPIETENKKKSTKKTFKYLKLLVSAAILVTIAVSLAITIPLMLKNNSEDGKATPSKSNFSSRTQI